MLLGNSPFDAYNMQELVEKIEEGTYKVPTNLSKEVISFLNGMLQYDPNKRLTAEQLYNHAFLTKNVSEFTHINANMVSGKVYGGQLNIILKIINQFGQYLMKKIKKHLIIFQEISTHQMLLYPNQFISKQMITHKE